MDKSFGDQQLEMLGLNQSFADALKQKLELNRAADLRMLFRQYENHLANIEKNSPLPEKGPRAISQAQDSSAHSTSYSLPKTTSFQSKPAILAPLEFQKSNNDVANGSPMKEDKGKHQSSIPTPFTFSKPPSQSAIKEDKPIKIDTQGEKTNKDAEDDDVMEIKAPPKSATIQKNSKEEAKAQVSSLATAPPLVSSFIGNKTATPAVPTLGAAPNGEKGPTAAFPFVGNATGSTGGFDFGVNSDQSVFGGSFAGFGAPGTLSSFGGGSGFQFNIPSFGGTSSSSGFSFPTFAKSTSAPEKTAAAEDDEEGIPLGEEASFSGERTNTELIKTGAGEEEEQTLLDQRVKLYIFEKATEGPSGTWKDLGIVLFKINQRHSSDADNWVERCRMLARSEGTGRVVLNSWITTGVQVDHNETGNRAKDVKVLCINQEGKPAQYLIRCKEPGAAAALAHDIRQHVPPK